MFNYSKALPLALLFSLPIVAMENNSNALAQSVMLTQAFQETIQSRVALEEQRKRLEMEICKQQENEEQKRKSLLDKITEKQNTLTGIDVSITDTNAQLEALTQRKQQYLTDKDIVAAELARIQAIINGTSETNAQLTELTAPQEQEASKKEISSSHKRWYWFYLK